MGFPIMGYMENYGGEHDSPGIMASIFGWFRDSPWGRGGPDTCRFGFTGAAASAPAPSGLEDDWGISPVLYSLPPGRRSSRDGRPLTPTVAVYHTHATESYLPEVGKKNAEAAFTSDVARSVIKVGEYLFPSWKAGYRIACVHSKTVHDADSRLGAYYRSEQTVKALLDKYPSCGLLRMSTGIASPETSQPSLSGASLTPG